MKRKNPGNTIFALAPVLGLVFLFALFLAIALFKDVNISYSLKNIFNQSLVVIVLKTTEFNQNRPLILTKRNITDFNQNMAECSRNTIISLSLAI